MAEVALDAGDALLPLHLLVDVDRNAEVLDMSVTGDASDIRDTVIRQYLRLCLVQLQIPHSAEVV